MWEQKEQNRNAKWIDKMKEELQGHKENHDAKIYQDSNSNIKKNTKLGNNDSIHGFLFLKRSRPSTTDCPKMPSTISE